MCGIFTKYKSMFISTRILNIASRWKFFTVCLRKFALYTPILTKSHKRASPGYGCHGSSSYCHFILHHLATTHIFLENIFLGFTKIIDIFHIAINCIIWLVVEVTWPFTVELNPPYNKSDYQENCVVIPIMKHESIKQHQYILKIFLS